MELSERLLHNDPELQHLYLSSDTHHIPKLVQALLSHNNTNINTHLRHVYFRNFKVGDGSLPQLLQAMKHLPNLQSLFFHCTEVPAGVLANILTTSHHLTALGLRYCKLQYETEIECQELEAALANSATLQDICVEGCEWQGTTDGHYSLHKMSSFLQSIAQIPTLQHLECVLATSMVGPQQQRFSAATLQSLCRIPRLQSLRLRHVWFPEEDVALFCHALPPSLCKLILSCDFGSTAARALGHLLQQQPHLQHLSLRIDRLLDPDSPQLLAQALQRSHSLQHFHLSGQAASQISAQAKRAFRDTIRTNSRLEFFRLDLQDYALQSEIAFYLQLNHRGRRALFQKLAGSGCIEETRLWVQALAQNATDVRALHYFLSVHPALFATAALQKANDEEEHHSNTNPQPYYQDWEAEDGIVYDSDGW